MFLHFLKTSLRRLRIDKTLSLINIFGLVIGIASAFLLSKYIGYFLTMDDFHEQQDQLFAIHQTLNSDAVSDKYTKSTYNGMAPLAKSEFPEVLAMSRYITTAETLVTVKKPDGSYRKYNENNLVEVDNDFLKMFTLHFISGNPDAALLAPNTIVISASMKQKYFGDEDPMDQVMTITKPWGGKKALTVKGVFKDYPGNSTFRFDCLQSLTGKEYEVSDQDWSYPYFKSYVRLKDATDADHLSAKMTTMVNDLEAFSAGNQQVAFELVNFKDLTELSDSQVLLILVAIFLLLITWINYTNLSGAYALTRGKEYGVRKVLGSSKTLLIKQFLYEALLIYSLATLAALAVVIISYPFIDDLTGGQILPIFEFKTPINLLFLLVLFGGSFISIIIPSFSVSGTSVSRLMKQKSSGSKITNGLRSSLVVFQLVVSLIMLVGVSTVYHQMDYIQNRDLGFNNDQTVILKAPKDGWEGKLQRLSQFKIDVRGRAYARNVTSSTTVPLWWGGAPTDFILNDGQEKHRMRLIGTDYEYFNGYDLQILVGKPYQRGNFKRNRQLAVINESAAKALGFLDPQEALNQKITNQKNEETLEVVAVVADYHHNSLRAEIEPQVFHFNPFMGFVSIHLNGTEQNSMAGLSNILSDIENIWNQTYPDQAFDYYFLDQRFNELYETERLFHQMFMAFAGISIVVTFMGLFGLSIFISMQRRKEMGVRKVLGASLLQVLILFNHSFMRKVGIAAVLGIPLAHYLMDMWLANFSYQFELTPWIFLFPALALTLLTLSALSFESVKLARVNPTEILRDE